MNRNKPLVRHSQFNRAFKNTMFGYSDERCKFGKVRFLRRMKATPLLFSLKNQPKFGHNKVDHAKFVIESKVARSIHNDLRPSSVGV